MIIEKQVKKIHGSKAFNLWIIKQKGLNVPDFWIIPSNIIINQTIQEISDNIWNFIQNKGIFILRSSATEEDGLKNSFAGVFDSYKIKTKKDIAFALSKLKGFEKSEKVNSYLKETNSQKKIKMNIILQKYIKGDFSGVAFVNNDEIIINAKKGTNEDVVNGYDSYEFKFNNQNKKISGGTFFLSKKTTLKLLSTLRKIKNIFERPQDIEWTIKDKTIYILQSRNITKEINKQVIVWDNSNIIESYPGVVLPLTESFVFDLYNSVYKNVAIHSGVSKKKIKSYDLVFNQLLGSFNGHFYYNMLNWYKMLTLFPGYSRNKINFDIMINARSKAELDAQYSKNVSFFFKLKYYSLILYKYFRLDKTIKYFEKQTNQKIRELNPQKIKKMDFDKCFYEFKRLKNQLIDIWYIPIENDFVAMTFYGLLSLNFKKNNLSSEFLLNCLSDINNLYTLQQIDDLIKIAYQIKSINILDKLLTKQNYDSFQKELNNYPKIKKLIDEYFKKYEGRFTNELKLESKELKKSSKEFFQLILNYKELKINKKKKKYSKNLSAIQRYYLKKTKKHLKKREEMRIIRAKVFNLARKLFLKMGEELVKQRKLNKKEDIFYLRVSELNNIRDFKKIVLDRKKEYSKFKKINMPSIIYTNEKNQIISFEDEEILLKDMIFGKPCSNGQVKGKASIIEDSSPNPSKKYEIIVTKTADPGWTPILSLCKGLIIEKGGLLSHISILARELEIPCIINAKNATKIIKNGQQITMNGTNGKIYFD